VRTLTSEAVESMSATTSVRTASPTIPRGAVSRPEHVLWLVILVVLLEDWKRQKPGEASRNARLVESLVPHGFARQTPRLARLVGIGVYRTHNP